VASITDHKYLVGLFVTHLDELVLIDAKKIVAASVKFFFAPVPLF